MDVRAWLEKRENISFEDIRVRLEDERYADREQDERKYCSVCHWKFTKRGHRKRHIRQECTNGECKEYKQTWCEKCHDEMDRGTAPPATTLVYQLFDKETGKPLAIYRNYYRSFADALDSTGFELSAVRSNMPIDRFLEFSHRYQEERLRPPDWYAEEDVSDV